MAQFSVLSVEAACPYLFPDLPQHVSLGFSTWNGDCMDFPPSFAETAGHYPLCRMVSVLGLLWHFLAIVLEVTPFNVIRSQAWVC